MLQLAAISFTFLQIDYFILFFYFCLFVKFNSLQTDTSGTSPHQKKKQQHKTRMICEGLKFSRKIGYFLVQFSTLLFHLTDEYLCRPAYLL